MPRVANLLYDQGKYAEAEPLFREALEGYRRELGDAHPDYGDTCYNFAIFLVEQGKHDEAASFFDRAAAAYEQCYGASHSETEDARSKAAALRAA